MILEGIHRAALDRGQKDIDYFSLLKACVKRKDISNGSIIHADLLKRGLLDKNPFLGSIVINMYAKCAELESAQCVLEKIKVRNVVCWNALVSGFVQQDRGNEALSCFEKMLDCQLSPDVTTFICTLKACGVTESADKGLEIHSEIIRQGLPGPNISLGTALVDMYVKLGLLNKAKEVHDGLPARDVVSWSVLILGYAQNGQGKKALDCFEQMKNEGICPNSVTFISVLKACSTIGALDMGERIHDEIVHKGLLGKDIVLGNALVDMYAKCGALQKAEQVLNELPDQNVVSWNTLLTGYIQKGQCLAVLNCFHRMQNHGFSPGTVAYACVLKACGTVGDLDMGKNIHDEIVRKELLLNDIMLGTAIVDMYAKCGDMEKAEKLLLQLPNRNAVSWNAVIMGYAHQSQLEEAMDCFRRMEEEGISPDSITFICILKACGNRGSVDMGKQIHDEIVDNGLLKKDIALGNALLDMYAKCGDLIKAKEVFDDLPIRSVVSWSALIAGYAQNGQGEEALALYESMQREGFTPNTITFLCVLKACASIKAFDKGSQIHDEIESRGLLNEDIMLGNALVDMYIKCGALLKAKQVHENLPTRNIVSWNILIAGYVEQKQGEEAWKCFMKMLSEGHQPDAVTYISTLKVCGSMVAVDKGKSIHEETLSKGLLQNNILLRTALVDMYSKCGEQKNAAEVLHGLPMRDVVSWNALMTGYAQLGQGHEALNCFDHMQQDSVLPDATTFLSVLNACNHSGLVDEAEILYLSISEDYGFGQDLDHHTCMVDLFGRAGQFEKAMVVIQKMPCSDYPLIWVALLGACQKWGNMEFGTYAFKNAMQLGSSNVAPYILMTNISVAAVVQKDSVKFSMLMDDDNG